MLTSVQKSEARRAPQPNIDRILLNVDNVRSALEWCRDRGLSVYAVDVATPNPKIMVETSGKCASLVREGLAAEIGSQTFEGIRSRVMCATVDGCEVMWIERGN